MNQKERASARSFYLSGRLHSVNVQRKAVIAALVCAALLVLAPQAFATRSHPFRAGVTASRRAPRSEQDGGLWSDLDKGGFAVGLMCAALIGAAGGKVYAGILGPRR
jgi:hypothetical protein